MAIDSLTFAMHVDEERKRLIKTNREKGVEISDNATLREAVNAVGGIETAGESAYEAGLVHEVTYYDLDGTVLKVEYVEDGGVATPPEDPSYDSEYLTFTGWCYIPETITQDIGINAHYRVTDGATRLFVTLGVATGLNLSIGTSGDIDIDWGDGTVDTVTGAVTNNHTYAEAGDYVIKITGEEWNFLNASGSTYVLGSESKNKALVKLYLGNGLNKVLNYCFHHCTNLKAVLLSDNISTFNSYIFNNNHNLKIATIPENITSLTGTFEACYSFINVAFHDNITNLIEVLELCYGVKCVKLPKSLKTLGTYCLSGCCLIKKLNIPEGVTTIGSNCCESMYGLEEIIMPSTLTSVSYVNTFSNVYNLKRAIIKFNTPKTGSVWAFGNPHSLQHIVFEKPQDKLISFYNAYALKEIIIPEGTKEISSFNSCKGLKSINIPEGILNIPNGCFYDCYNLLSITLPNSLQSIGSTSFSGCRTLNSIIIPANVISLGAQAFMECYALQEVIMQCNMVPTIGNNIFTSGIPTIWVKDNLLEEYKTATNWSAFADYIRPLSEREV